MLLTTRDLRVIADVIERLTRARKANDRVGVSHTPDVMNVRFPTGHVAVVRWFAAVHSDDPAQQRIIELGVRHRSGYQLDLATRADPTKASQLHGPTKRRAGYTRPVIDQPSRTA